MEVQVVRLSVEPVCKTKTPRSVTMTTIIDTVSVTDTV